MDRDQLDLRDLRYLLAVARAGSISAAAVRLHMTQPPLTRHLARLERNLGVTLLERGQAGSRLTPAGLALATAAPDLLARVDRAVQSALHPASELGGPLHIGYHANMTHRIVVPALQRLAATHPGLTADPVVTDRAQQLRLLRAGDLDVALLWSPVDEPDLHTYQVGVEPVAVVLPARHPLAPSRSLRLAQLAAETWLMTDLPGSRDRIQDLRSRCDADGFAPNIRTVDSMDTVTALVAAGQGIGVGPSSAARAAPDGVRTVPLTRWQVAVIALTTTTSATPAVDAFLAATARL